MKKELKFITVFLLITSWAIMVYGIQTKPEIDMPLIQVGMLLNLVSLIITLVHAYKTKAGILWLISLFFISSIAVPAYLLTAKTREGLDQ